MTGTDITLRALSALLTYPDAALTAAAPALASALAEEGRLSPAALDALATLLRSLAQEDLYELEEAYVSLFDRTRRLSLHLFEHVHGESRDRGQAMVDLAALYETGGLLIATNELPDFLPLFLEYAATRPREEACALLADVDHILAGLEERLMSRATPYSAVFGALRSLAGSAQLAEAPSEPSPRRRTNSLPSTGNGKRPPSRSAPATPWAAAPWTASAPNCAPRNATRAIPPPEGGRTCLTPSIRALRLVSLSVPHGLPAR